MSTIVFIIKIPGFNPSNANRTSPVQQLKTSPDSTRLPPKKQNGPCLKNTNLKEFYIPKRRIAGHFLPFFSVFLWNSTLSKYVLLTQFATTSHHELIYNFLFHFLMPLSWFFSPKLPHILSPNHHLRLKYLCSHIPPTVAIVVVLVTTN